MNKMSNLHAGFVLQLPQKHHDKLVEIKRKNGISIAQQVRIAVADYLRGSRHEL